MGIACVREEVQGVLMSGNDVVDQVRSASSGDVYRDVHGAATALVGRAKGAGRISMVAVVSDRLDRCLAERSPLGRVVLVRFGVPGVTWTSPFADWPEDLRRSTLAGVFAVGGGHEIDGREVLPFDYDEVEHVAEELRQIGSGEAVVVSSPFSVLYPQHELRAREIFEDKVGGPVVVVCAHEVAGISILLREAAAILNAALIRPAGNMVETIRRAVRESGIDPDRSRLMTGRGLVCHPDYALAFPISLLNSSTGALGCGARFLVDQADFVALDARRERPLVAFVSQGMPEPLSVREVQGALINYAGPRAVGPLDSLELAVEWVTRTCNVSNRSVVVVGSREPGGCLPPGWNVVRSERAEVIEALGVGAAREGAILERFFAPGVPVDSAMQQMRELSAKIAAQLCRFEPDSFALEIARTAVPFLPEGSLGLRGFMWREPGGPGPLSRDGATHFTPFV